MTTHSAFNWWQDPRWWLAVLLPLPLWGAMVWLSPFWPNPAWTNAPSYLWIQQAPLVWLNLVILWPVAEELLFRGVLQGRLLQHWSANKAMLWLGISRANLITSLLFTALHWALQPGWLALAVILPSFIFGWTRERHGSLLSPCLLHVMYNAGWFWLRPPDGL